MIKIVTIIIFCIVTKTFAQIDSIITYFNNNSISSVIHYRDSVREGSASFYWENGNIKQELDYVNGKVDGLVRNYDSTGTLREMYNVDDGKRNGPTTLFDSTGTYIKDVTYKDGLMEVEKFELDDYKSRQLANKEQNKNSVSVTRKKVNNGNNPLPEIEDDTHNYEDDPAFYLTVEVMPEPVGGMESIYKRLRYPEEAKDDEIEGTVKILAFIDRNGEVIDAQVLEGIGHGCDEAARQAVYYHRFKPGLQRGQKVKVQMVIPIEFKLNKSEN